jgi:hypothetical protein
MMEVICINCDFSPHIDIEGNLLPDAPECPYEGEICYVLDVRVVLGITVYQLEGFPHITWYEAANFVDITNLQEQIDAALKAPKPVKKVYRFIEQGYKMESHCLDLFEYYSRRLLFKHLIDL